MKNTIFFLIISALFFSACVNNTPKCSDKKTKELVIQIAKDELKAQGMSSIIPNLNYEVTTIRTTKHNKNVDSYECAADFKMIRNDKTETLPITYTVELTDDGKEFYVSVSGFR